MRVLKYAILGILNYKDMTGYDLMKEFETTLSEFWSAQHSQIYPELKKLTEENCITYKVEIAGNVMEKKMYSITESGKKEFLEWLEKEIKMEKTPKDVFRLKLFFSSSLSIDVRIRHLESQLIQHEKRLEHLKRNQEKFPGIPDKNAPDFGDYLVLMGAIMREETQCEWLKKCLEMSE